MSEHAPGTQIELADDGEVHVLTMRSGENRLNLPFVLRLHELLDETESRGGPVVLTGDGKHFSNGLDLEWMGEADPADLRRCMDEIHRLLARILVFPAATAAAVNGHAFGAGAMLAAAADFRVMRADRGYFCFPEIDLGLPMSDEFSALLQDKYPKPALHEAWITGARFGADEATGLGLVDQSAAANEVVGAAVARIRPLAGKDGQTMQALKSSLFATALSTLTR